ncbi:cellulose biosynthesis cyclic di-GMP-binding regulatory protein BcsB [Salipiger mucosus]|nr:cellulose biosynthesis cyclic di-GMP-binding regulatory protein BcsB [Salipiger mucosus]
MSRGATVFLLTLIWWLLPREGTAQLIELDDLPDVPDAATVAPSEPGVAPTVQQHGNRGVAGSDAGPTTQPIMLPLRPTRPQISTDRVSYRIQGQFETAEFALILPSVPGGATLAMASQSSIDVLPERSEIGVSVNGTFIGTLVPDNFDAARTDRLQVPDGVLRTGRNLVTLEVRHVHRVFCGPDAAFSVWTDILLSGSGVEVMPNELGTDPLGFLSAVAAELGRGRAVTIRTSGREFPIADAAPVIARVGDIFDGLPPDIDFAQYYTAVDGPAQLARVTVLPSGRTDPDLPQFRRGGDGAIVLLANAGRYADTGALLLGALPRGADKAETPRLEPGAPQSLEELGAPQIEGRGRYINKAVSFRLPRNWLLLASQRAELLLDYWFDSDLPEGSLLLVKVNGTTVRLLPLDEAASADRALDTLRIPFPANTLRPGVNQLSFEALVPGDPPDEACVPRSSPIFRVDGTTQLHVPPSPAMSMPDIHRVFENIRPEGIGMSDAAQGTLSLGILPQLAAIYATGDSGDRDETANHARLTVGVPSDLTSMTGDVVGGNNSRLREVLLTRVSEKTEAVDPWERVNEGRWWRVFHDLDRARELPARLREWFVAIWQGPESSLETWLQGQAAEAMLIQPDTNAPQDVWLIVRPNVDPRPVVAALALLHGQYGGPNGQVSLFSSDAGWTSWHSSSRPLRLHEPLTLANARAVVGNYVTITPGRYVLPLLSLALFSSVIAMGIMLLSRRRRE